MFCPVCCILLIAQVAGQSATLVIVNGSRGITQNGGQGELIEIDLATKSSRIINTAMPAEWQFVMSAVVCGDKWYGIAEQIPQCAVASVDLKTGKFEGVTHVDFFPYVLGCGDKTGEVLVISADVPMHFGLRKLNMADGSSQVIGTFPNATDNWEGYQSIFSFSNGLAWAAFSAPAAASPTSIRSPSSSATVFQREGQMAGTLYKMDVSTGKVELHATFPASGGTPYYVAPSQSGKTFGIFDISNGNDLTSPTLSFCDVDISGNKIAESNCQKDNTWFTSGAAPLQCGSDPLYYFAAANKATDTFTPILGGSRTEKFVDAYHLAYQYTDESAFYIGSLACADIKMVVV